MEAILLSINPKNLAAILSGNKRIEIRATAPEHDLPIDVYLYCTKRGKKLVIYEGYMGDEMFTGYEATSDKELIDNAALEILNGKVVAKFTLEKVKKIKQYASKEFGMNEGYSEDYGTDTLEEKSLLKLACLQKNEMARYLRLDKYGHLQGYAWYISNVIIFDKPKELKDFIKRNIIEYVGNGYFKLASINYPPQSWQYVEVEKPHYITIESISPIVRN